MTLFVSAGCQAFPNAPTGASSPAVAAASKPDPVRLARARAALASRPIPFVFLVRYDENGTPAISSSMEPTVTRTPSGIYRITFAPAPTSPAVAAK